MYSKVLNYPAASSATSAHSRFVAGSSAAVVSSSASTSSSSFNFDNLRLDDILCAVCQSVLVEPVYLPCHHLFCRNCIRETIETNNLYCPCCRKRFGTWYRHASRANELVHEQLWRAIQSQFREHLDEDTPSGSSKSSSTQQVKPLYTAPSTSKIHLANAGEIGKEFKDELKRYQKEIFEEKTKELTASEQYIINLYKQEGIIDLADNSSHVSVSSATTPDLQEGLGCEKAITDNPVAGPSTVRKPAPPSQISSLNGTKTKSPSNGSVISISSTSSAASGLTASSCVTSSASGRYSLIKSVAQKVGRSAEIVKQKVQDTFLHRLTTGKLQQHQRTLNAMDLNKSDLCVKPTAVHKLDRRGVEGVDDAAGDDSDSLKSEQNHFIPIVQSMPRSSFSCNTFRRVLAIRPVPSPLKYESSPKKSPYQPLQFDKSASAFKVVKLQILTPPANPLEESGGTLSSTTVIPSALKKELLPTTGARRRGRPRRIQFSPTTSRKEPNDSESVASRSRPRRTVVLQANTLKDIICRDQQRREQQIEMERRDFEFAQKLQQKLNRSSGVMQEIQRQPPVARSTGYSLRRKTVANGYSGSSASDSCTVYNTTQSVQTPSSNASTKQHASRKRKATSSSVENDVPSSSSPAKQMKTRRQTKQIRTKHVNDTSLLEPQPAKAEPEPGTVPLRKSTRNKTR
uniref:RING-type E3 ubiquitin transferase n=1 Tax=Anopheles dirus TaxID=7168 RepID=A0A182NQL4_9DIPT